MTINLSEHIGKRAIKSVHEALFSNGYRSLTHAADGQTVAKKYFDLTMGGDIDFIVTYPFEQYDFDKKLKYVMFNFGFIANMSVSLAGKDANCRYAILKRLAERDNLFGAKGSDATWASIFYVDYEQFCNASALSALPKDLEYYMLGDIFHRSNTYADYMGRVKTGDINAISRFMDETLTEVIIQLETPRSGDVPMGYSVDGLSIGKSFAEDFKAYIVRLETEATSYIGSLQFDMQCCMPPFAAPDNSSS